MLSVLQLSVIGQCAVQQMFYFHRESPLSVNACDTLDCCCCELV